MVYRGIGQIEKREERTERIPQTGVGVHITGKYLPVIRAVMHGLSFGINLIKLAREKGGTIQAAVECALLVKIATFNIDASQYVVPGITTL